MVKKRKIHKPSVLHQKDGTCYLCIRLNADHSYYPTVQEHHIFDGPNRNHSEAHGMKVYLCVGHHTFGPESVHKNKANKRFLQREAQKAFEEEHSHEEFMEIFGRNYLEG